MFNIFNFFPSEVGLLDIEKKNFLKRRRPFSHYLPYDSFENELFKNKDGTKGFIFLCSPFWRENPSARTIFSAIVKELPDDMVLSVSLISLDYIKPILENYKRLKQVRKNSLIEKVSQNFANFLDESTKTGLPHSLGVSLKTFFLLVSFHSLKKKDDEWFTNYKIMVEQQLKGCGLSPKSLEPEFLINLLFNLFNGQWMDLEYDSTRSIASQLILSDTEIKAEWNRLKIGKKYWKCITPRNLPKDEFFPEIIGELIGPGDGPMSDGRQIKSHFFFSVIVYHSSFIHREIIKKTAMFFNQLKGEAHKSIIGRLIGEYAIEHSQAVEDIEKGDKFFYVFPVFWVWDENYKRLKQSAQQVRNLFEENGFSSQEEKGILPILFLMSLPFGFNFSQKEINTLDRHFVCKSDGAAGILPLVGDISGFGEPACLFVSRKAQLVTFDPFHKEAPNNNCIVMGTTGGGKSVNMNLLTYSMYANGALIRIIDLGYSYLKQCKLFKGEYIDFSTTKPICLNPFSFVNEKDEDFQGALETIAEMVLSMVFEGSQEKISKEHIALIRSAVVFTYREWGKEGGIDCIYSYLANFPGMAGDEIGEICQGEESCFSDLKKEAQKLAFSLIKWTSKEVFGKWFNGKSTINLLSSDYLVFELEKIKRIPHLLKVVTLAVMNAVTNSFYLTNKDKKKIFLLEECGIILKDVPGLKRIIQEAYRRIRKYNGSAITVFQSPMDLQELGETGRVILGNSAYWFMLPSNQYEKAKKEKIIELSEDILQLLSSIRLTAPRYGEICLKTPFGTGVVRTVLNGFFYYLVTTNPKDWQMIIKEVERIRKDTKKEEIEILIEVIEKFGKKRDREFMEKFL